MTRRTKIKTEPATPQSIKLEGRNIIIDGISYKIPVRLLGGTDEEIIAFYKGWYRKQV